jgi:hypothetical protein
MNLVNILTPSRTGNREQDCQNRTTRTGQLGQDTGMGHNGRSVGIGHLRQSHSDGTGKSRQISPDMSV